MNIEQLAQQILATRFTRHKGDVFSLVSYNHFIFNKQPDEMIQYQDWRYVIEESSPSTVDRENGVRWTGAIVVKARVSRWCAEEHRCWSAWTPFDRVSFCYKSQSGYWKPSNSEAIRSESCGMLPGQMFGNVAPPAEQIDRFLMIPDCDY